MKRSEAIELLYRAWREHIGDYGGINTKPYCHMLLKTMEEAGMSPPWNPKTYVVEWEPEEL